MIHHGPLAVTILFSDVVVLRFTKRNGVLSGTVHRRITRARCGTKFTQLAECDVYIRGIFIFLPAFYAGAKSKTDNFYEITNYKITSNEWLHLRVLSRESSLENFVSPNVSLWELHGQ